MKGKILGWQMGMKTTGDGDDVTCVDIEIAGRPYTRDQMVAMVGTEAEVFLGDYEFRPMPALTWTDDTPTVPASYLYAYRFEDDGEWTEGRIRVTTKMIADGIFPDSSATLWFGPIPELPKPTKEGGEG